MENKDINTTGKFAAILSMTEVGLGSLLHAWRLPFTGQFLSLNQAFISCKAIKSSSTRSPWIPLQIAMIGATLKSLAPAGKRLTPMLAISMQGFILSSFQFILGTHFLGTLVSVLAMCLWAFIQPLAIYLLVFGRDIFYVADYFFKKIQKVIPIEYEHLAYAISGLVAIKLLLGLVVVLLVYTRTDKECESYFKRLQSGFDKINPKRIPQSLSFSPKLRLVFKDMTQPWFLISIALMLVFFFLTNPKGVMWIWLLMRPLACGFIVFYALRFLPVNEWLDKMTAKSNSQYAQILQQSLMYIRGEVKNK